MTPAPTTAAAPRARRRAWALVAAALGMAITARAGFWQLDRAAQKIAWAERMAQRGALPQLDAHALAHDEAAAAEQHQRRVTLRGRWLARHTIYLDNRPLHGQAGFIVATPLELVPGDAVLVQRGWVPRDALDRTRLKPVDTPDGVVEIVGRIAPPPSALLSLGTGEAGPIRQNLDLVAFAGEIGTPLRPLSVQQTEPAHGEGLEREWPVPVADVGKHHGYAFQWFTMCALIAGAVVWFHLLRPRFRAARNTVE